MFPLMLTRPDHTAITSRVQNMRTALARVWSPKGLAEQVARDWPGHATGEAAVLWWRVRMLTLALGWIGLAMVAASLTAWFAGYRTNFAGAAFLTGASICATELAMMHAFRLWLLFKIGGWGRRSGGPVRRSEQPARFWAWAAASSGILTILEPDPKGLWPGSLCCDSPCRCQPSR